jgi:hypothetical protein
VAKKISSIGDSRDCQSGSSINRTTRMIRLVPALLCAPPYGERRRHLAIAFTNVRFWG